MYSYALLRFTIEYSPSIFDVPWPSDYVEPCKHSQQKIHQSGLGRVIFSRIACAL
jgi:hypothetical protein